MERPQIINFLHPSHMRCPMSIGTWCPPLKLEEWKLLCTLLQNTIRTDEVSLCLYQDVTDFDQEDWSFDLQEFSKRLKGHAQLQNLSILHAVDNFWKLYPLKMAFAETLKKAGAKIDSE